MAEHPIDSVYRDDLRVAKASVRGFSKERERLRFADADEVRNTKLLGQWGGIYVAELDDDFNYAHGDTTSADDGVDVIVSLDGKRFTRRVLSTPQSAPVYQYETSDTTIDVAPETDILVVRLDTPAPATFNLGAAASRSGRPVKVIGETADPTNTLTPLTGGGEQINDSDPSGWGITNANGEMTYTPHTNGTDRWTAA